MAQRPSILSTVNKVLTLVTVLVAVGGLVYAVTAAMNFWGNVSAPVGSVTDAGRALVGIEKPRAAGVPPNEADARDIAAAVAIDLEGEDLALLGEARIEYIDAILRTKKRLPHLTYRQIVAKAVTWVPDNWQYPRQWRDRDESVISTGRGESVKELIPVVLARMRAGPAEGCATKIVRAKWHAFGWMGGESGAAKTIRSYPKDPRLEKKGFRTDFRCLPPQ